MNILKQIAERMHALKITPSKTLSKPRACHGMGGRAARAEAQEEPFREAEAIMGAADASEMQCVDVGIGQWLVLQDDATQERFIERAAIAEFEGGASRLEAERLAFESYGGELGAAGVMAARWLDGTIEEFTPSVQD